MPKSTRSSANLGSSGADEIVIKDGAKAARKIASDALADPAFEAEHYRLHIVSMQRQLSTLKRELLKAKQALGARRSSSANNDANKIEVKPEVIIDLEHQLSESRAEIVALRASTSWRITAPLRRLKGG